MRGQLRRLHTVLPVTRVAPLPGGFPPIDQGQLAVRDIGRLLLQCADRPGLVAAVSAFLSAAGANIISLDQHSTAQSGGMFMQRTIFHLPGLAATRDALEAGFRAVE